MIVVAGTVVIDADRHEAMVDAANLVSAATRQEDGCLSYEFFADLTDRSRFHVFEEWENLEALEAHLRTDHIRTFGASLRECGIKGSEIYRYAATGKTAVS